MHNRHEVVTAVLIFQVFPEFLPVRQWTCIGPYHHYQLGAISEGGTATMDELSAEAMSLHEDTRYLECSHVGNGEYVMLWIDVTTHHSIPDKI